MSTEELFLEKRGRGRGISSLTGNRPWALRSFKLIEQSFHYYDGDKLKGTINTRNSRTRIIDENSSHMDREAVANKKFPLLMETIEDEKVYLNASTEYFRLKAVDILNRSSKKPNWNNTLDNEVAEADIQIKLTGKKEVKETQKQIVEVFHVVNSKQRFRDAKRRGNKKEMSIAATDMIISAWRCKQARRKMIQKKKEKKQQEEYRRKLDARRKIINFLRMFCAYRIVNRLKLRVRIAKRNHDCSIKIIYFMRRLKAFLRLEKLKRFLF